MGLKKEIQVGFLVLLYSKVGCELKHQTALLYNRQVVDVLQP